MACEQACFDCPFLRFADKDILKGVEMFDYIVKHFTEDGGFVEINCEEQGDICFGQIQVISNGYKYGLDKDSELGKAVEQTKPNTKDYFKGGWEITSHYWDP